MEYTQEQIDKAIRIARKLAEAEKNTTILKESVSEKVSEEDLKPYFDYQREKVGDGHEKIINNPLAEKLLPQARIIERMEDARGEAIDHTFFGKLRDALTDLEAFVSGELAPEDALLIENPFEEDFDNEAWTQFVDALRNGDEPKTLYALSLLLAAAKRGVIETDLPPVAPDFEIPE